MPPENERSARIMISCITQLRCGKRSTPHHVARCSRGGRGPSALSVCFVLVYGENSPHAACPPPLGLRLQPREPVLPPVSLCIMYCGLRAAYSHVCPVSHETHLVSSNQRRAAWRRLLAGLVRPPPRPLELQIAVIRRRRGASQLSCFSALRSTWRVETACMRQ